ncbi:MAG TPA: Gmad2 immunoglobulin-like domain-containing protein [Chloroflexia bacterium]|nr:Gmad2 immunoglobulin-like domain-containing protein [Chloroflexia bacterium]
MKNNGTARFSAVGILLVIITLVATACGGPATTASTPVAPAQKVQDATPDPLSTQMGPPMENSLRIAEPLPGSVLTDSVTVRGEGRAFENTILVEVKAGGQVLGKEIVTTAADTGQVGEFTVTVKLTPVAAPTDGTLRIYTESPVDGSIDQQTSVPVKLMPLDTPATLTVQPSIHLAPGNGKGGTVVVVSGEGFPAGGDVEVRLGGLQTGATQQVYATTQADKMGAITASFTMPERWPNGDSIVQPQVVVLASTPDLVTKASAVFEYGSEQASTSKAEGTALQAAQDFVSVWIKGDEKAVLGYLDSQIRQTVQADGDMQGNIARLMGVQNIPQSSSVETIRSGADLTIVRVTLQFAEGSSQADLALKQSGGKWLITGIKAVAFAP